MLQVLGPDAIAELVTEYDQLYDQLIKIPIDYWSNPDMKSMMERTKHISLLEDMIEIYEYVLQEEKREIVTVWYKLLKGSND